MDKYQQLVDQLVDDGYLISPEVVDAFRNTPRKDFLRKSHQFLEGLNTPLPIGSGQTISQPLTVAFMLNLLKLQPGDKVLDIGYGSGWQTAIITRIICPEKQSNGKNDCGEVIGYEIVPDVAKFGKSNLKKALPKRLYKQITLYCEDYGDSYEKHAPYDKIIAAAAFDEDPSTLIKSLKKGGTIVYPTKQNDIRTVTRKTKKKFVEDVYPGFVFVPITH